MYSSEILPRREGSDSDHDSDLEAVSNGESSEKTPLIDSDEKTKKKNGVLGQFFSAIRLA